LRDMQQVLRPAGVGSFGPMKYALSLQMGSPQSYQRPPHPDVTEEQKVKIREGLQQIKADGMSTTELLSQDDTDDTDFH